MVTTDNAWTGANFRRGGRYRDAGATEVVFSSTEIAGEADRRRTWRLLGELAR